MAVLSVYPIVAIARMVRRYRAARAQSRTRRQIEALPRHMQKDIGWPEGIMPGGSARSRETWPL